MRIASGIVLGLTVLVFLGWWMLIRAPGPVAVCEHVVAITMQEASAEGLSGDTQSRLVETTRAQCIEHKLDKLQLRGRIKYAEHAKCVVAAQSLREIGHC